MLCLSDHTLPTIEKSLISLSTFCLLAIAIFHAPFANAQSVVINEFQVSSTQSVEVINTTENPVDISGWYIDDSSGSTYYTIPQGTILHSRSCVVFQSDFNLNTASADIVRLFDSTLKPIETGAVTIDSFAYSQAPASGSSYSRNPDGSGSFAISSPSFGLYNSSGTSCIYVSTPSQTPTVTPTPNIPPTPTPTTYPANFKDNIYLSEIMSYPQTGDEWVEIYNDNNFTVNVVDWYIDDLDDSGGSPLKFSGIIPAHSYFVQDISSSLFNNDADIARLLDENMIEVSFFSYSKNNIGLSWGTSGDILLQIFCQQSPTKNTNNADCIEATPTLTLTPTKTPTSTKTPTLTQTPTQAYETISGIFITEIFPRTDTDHPKEWVEIYNDNRFAVNLREWHLGDSSDREMQMFTVDIDPYKYGVIELSSSRLNNDGDTVYLMDPNQNVVDEFAYTSSEVSTSWGRKSGSFQEWCMQSPSKGDYNKQCLVSPTHTPTRTPTFTKTPTPTRTPTPQKATNMTDISSLKNSSTPFNSAQNVMGISSVKKKIAMSYTPRLDVGNKNNAFPLSFAVHAAQNTDELDDSKYAETNTSYLPYNDPILGTIIIVVLSLVVGFLTSDIWKKWEEDQKPYF